MSGPYVLGTRGPREHHARPAIDVLFRSVALEYGRAAVAILLSGANGDGTAGVLAVRAHDGTVIVQSPGEAEYPTMPEGALAGIEPDHVVPTAEIPALLRAIVSGRLTPPVGENTADHAVQLMQRDIESQRSGARDGRVSVYSCPDCGGTLWQLNGDRVIQFACHTGHRWTADTLLSQKSEHLEAALYEAVRLLKEKAMLLRQVAAKAAPAGVSGDRFVEEARRHDAHANLIQSALLEAVRGPERADE